MSCYIVDGKADNFKTFCFTITLLLLPILLFVPMLRVSASFAFIYTSVFLSAISGLFVLSTSFVSHSVYVCCLCLVHSVYVPCSISTVGALSALSASFVVCLLYLYLSHPLYLRLPSKSSVTQLLQLCFFYDFCDLTAISVLGSSIPSMSFVTCLLFVSRLFYLYLPQLICYTYAQVFSSVYVFIYVFYNLFAMLMPRPRLL